MYGPEESNPVSPGISRAINTVDYEPHGPELPANWPSAILLREPPSGMTDTFADFGDI